jgi:hypothetical protein
MSMAGTKDLPFALEDLVFNSQTWVRNTLTLLCELKGHQ